jgi:antitoxin YefM
MAVAVTYTQARDGLSKLLDRVAADREVVIIKRRGKDDVALIDASELSGLLETAYLLRSPKNAARLLEALGRSLRNEGRRMTLEELSREVGLDTQESEAKTA